MSYSAVYLVVRRNEQLLGVVFVESASGYIPLEIKRLP